MAEALTVVLAEPYTEVERLTEVLAGALNGPWFRLKVIQLRWMY